MATRKDLIGLRGHGYERMKAEILEGERECTCWVAKETEEVRFGIRFGAHCPNCSQYRKSGDPVDLANDDDLHTERCSPIELVNKALELGLHTDYYGRCNH